jgi:hypothetical protein
MDRNVLVDAWRSHNRQLAGRFSEAMRRARSELGQSGNFAAISKKAWALDPSLRAEFGDAVSSGLQRMWSNPAARTEQSQRVKRSYTADLRKQRSEVLRKRWADPAFRERMLRARGRAGEQPKQNGRAA